MPTNVKSGMTRYQLIDTLIKGVGVVALIVSGVFAVWQYREAKEAEIKAKFVTAQLETIDQIFSRAMAIDSEPDPAQQLKLARDLDNLIMIRGRAYLDARLYGAAKPMRDHINACLLPVGKKQCQWQSMSQSATGFSRAARENFDRVLHSDLGKIAGEDPFSSP